MDIEWQDFWSDGEVELFVLRPSDVGDAYVGWLNDPEINQFLESRFIEHTLESTRAYVGDMLASPGNMMLGIRSMALERHVGNIKLGPIDRHHGLGEVGLMIGERAAWGKGIATRAISIISRIGIDQLGLRKITAGCYATNAGSQKAFEKAGFFVEGVRENHFVFDNKPEHLVLLARFKDGLTPHARTAA